MSLKLSLAAAACALLLTADAHAQGTLFNMRFGPTFGWRDTNQSAFESDGMMQVGGGGGFRFGKGALSFEPNALIVGKNTKGPDVNVPGDEMRLKLQYIEFPLLGVLTLNRDAKVRPFLAAGPVIDLEMRCRVEFVDANSKDEVGCDLETTATVDRHKIDFGVAGAAGIDYRISENRRISLQARYTHGLSNISAADDPALVLRNRAVSVYLGYSFPLRTDI
jgi:hypothetical protein